MDYFVPKLFDQMENFFDDRYFLKGFENFSDVKDHGDYYKIITYVPGCGEEDLKIDVLDNKLKISGEPKKGMKINKSFYITKNIEKIEAAVDKGILELKLYKTTKNKIPIEFKH